jgi:hypothetical protein
MNKIDPTIANKRLLRWQQALVLYDFKIETIKGTENFMADYLSRDGS